MKMTLLELTQDILNDLDADEVNSINDTVESEQVAQILKTTYLEMVSNRNWPHLKKLIQMVGSTDPSKPTTTTLPQYVKEMCFVNYDCSGGQAERRDYKTMRYVAPEEFLSKSNKLNSTKDNVGIEVIDGIEILYQNDKCPEYFTSFDDDILIFDSYDNSIQNTLVTARFQAQAYMMPTWEHEDDSIPDLPSEAFSNLLEEAKSVAFLALKQQSNQKAEQKALRQRRWLSQKAWKVADVELYPDYGRKTISHTRNPYIDKNN